MSQETTAALDTIKHNLMDTATLADIRNALPPSMQASLNPERYAKMALATIGRSSAIWNCTPVSITKCILKLAETGLELGAGPLAQAYLVPYKGTCELIYAWPGLVALARRTGEISAVQGKVIYEVDKWEYEEGINAVFRHKPSLVDAKGKPFRGDKARGEIVAAYCITYYTNGTKTLNLMPRIDLDKRRAASPSANRSDSQWNKWEAEMSIKSVIKYAAKEWPKNPELAKALLHEDETDGYAKHDIYDSDEALARARPRHLQPVPALVEPKHDPQTGEVVAGPASDAIERICAATTIEEINAIRDEVKASPWFHSLKKEERKRIAWVRKCRLEELANASNPRGVDAVLANRQAAREQSEQAAEWNGVIPDAPPAPADDDVPY